MAFAAHRFEHADQDPLCSSQAADLSGLRIALFSGNYNYVRDGANMSLNRLVAYLEGRGAQVRIYSPTTDTPAFAPAGTLVSVPSIAMPRRREYRIALGLPRRLRRDLAGFAPHLVHLSAPDWLGHAARRWAQRHDVPMVASFHTRFETYLDYYRLGWLRPAVLAALRRFYRPCVHVYVPTPCMGAEIRSQGLSDNIRRWSRGVESDRFSPQARALDWRRSLGIADSDILLGFAGRLVLEKGLDQFVRVCRRWQAAGAGRRVLIVGEGPERASLETALPGAVFTGFLSGPELARAYASMDIFLNPSVTEAFGNVTLEAMASGLPAVCANATGSRSIVKDRVTGWLIPPQDDDRYVAVLDELARDPAMRARMAAASRGLALSYDWDSILAQMAGNYLEALGAPHASPAARQAGSDSIAVPA